MDHETITKLAEQEEAGSSGANFLPFLTGQPYRLATALLPARSARRLNNMLDVQTGALDPVIWAPKTYIPTSAAMIEKAVLFPGCCSGIHALPEEWAPRF